MIKVGVVGASGWAAGSHLPVLTGLPEFEVTAVATTRQNSADDVAAAFGVRHAFASARALTAHPDVDLVVVSVKVPEHAAVIRDALAAGKHVVSEWPLGVSAEEARELTEAATEAGVLHGIVLQGYHSPDAAFVADLLAAGRIGEIESVSVVAAGDPFGGGTLPEALEWSLDPAAGSSILTIMAGHFLATVERIAGRWREVTAQLPRLHEQVRVAGTGRTVPNQQPSHVLVRGRLESGAEASVTVHGGGHSPEGFLLKFVGSEGVLTATAATPGMYMHWTDWAVAVDGEPVSFTRPPEQGPNVRISALYKEIAQAIADGRQPHPSFETALRHHRLLASIELSARTGLPQAIR
ncbi:Gfo/Idh/MocA family oxidoreductase [Allokutzneria multivorans]|uniref:Gfo/Idh/MocA family oxidoreductase n=1 Tax=Allokutzneria multivorans TaxID=1142134 RepID=A0ABP7SI43_9PSEU